MAAVQVSNGQAALKLALSGSFRSRKKLAATSRTSYEADDVISLFHGSDPVRVELNRLEDELKAKDRELGEAQAEIKALKYTERLKEKAVEEMNVELTRVDEKLQATEALLEIKNLEIKKMIEEKKAALAAQFAAEATLRRVHATQKDDEMPPIETIITPLEAELKMAKMEVTKLLDDNRVLDRLTKSKEAALLEAERTVQLALAKASLVNDLQNKHQDLMKQIDICQEENRILDKMHRQKVAEVEKLMLTVGELEEVVLAGGAAANVVRDYQRKVQEMNEEIRILERELARAKISANRVAVVVANKWKDANDKVMPVRQWLDERRHFQGEMQQLREKLAIAERTAKAEAQLKERYQLRFEVLEDRLKASHKSVSSATSEGKSQFNRYSRRQSHVVVEALSKSSSNGLSSRNLQSGRAKLKHAKLMPSSFGGNDASLDEEDNQPNFACDGMQSNGKKLEPDGHGENNDIVKAKMVGDCVSGVLYDMLQKELIALTKACQEKDQTLKDKEGAIETLAKNVETINKAMEVETKRMRREAAAMEKELAATRTGRERDQKTQHPPGKWPLFTFS